MIDTDEMKKFRTKAKIAKERLSKEHFYERKMILLDMMQYFLVTTDDRIVNEGNLDEMLLNEHYQRFNLYWNNTRPLPTKTTAFRKLPHTQIIQNILNVDFEDCRQYIGIPYDGIIYNVMKKKHEYLINWKRNRFDIEIQKEIYTIPKGDAVKIDLLIQENSWLYYYVLGKEHPTLGNVREMNVDIIFNYGHSRSNCAYMSFGMRDFNIYYREGVVEYIWS